MINVEEFASRLKLMLNYYEISAAQLADKIEVQRSSISHILSGRNKPSLEFVLKILKAFPEVELYWLLNGKGTFPKVEENVANTSTLSPSIKKETTAEENFSEINKSQSEPNSNDLAIERIVIFYKNGTFKNYTP